MFKIKAKSENTKKVHVNKKQPISTKIGKTMLNESVEMVTEFINNDENLLLIDTVEKSRQNELMKTCIIEGINDLSNEPPKKDLKKTMITTPKSAILMNASKSENSIIAVRIRPYTEQVFLLQFHHY